MRCSSIRTNIIFAAMIVTLAAPVRAWAQTSGNQDTSAREFVERARASMVELTGEDKYDRPIAPGVGFFIGENLIATDNRVVKSAVRVYVRIAGQEKIEVWSRDSYRFATILTVTRTRSASSQVAPLPLGDSDRVAAKDKVYLVGDSAPTGAVSEGIVRKITTFNDRRYFQITAPMVNSSRGGPVFNSKGEVIGIAAESPDEQALGFAIPTSYLTTLLRYRNLETTGSGLGPGTGQGTNAGSDPQPGRHQPAPANAAPVDTRPVVQNSVQPRYTEEARQNQTQGIVELRILIDEEGKVKQARVTRGLPDGLIEQAMAAAYQLRFKPATRNGQAVSFWQAIDVEFNLR
jgi:TonB family protein